MKEMRGQIKKVAEYRRLALAEIALVETSALANVREKHEVSAARWDDLADQAEQAIAAHVARVRVAPIGLSAASNGLEGEACDLDLLTPDGAFS